MYQNGEEIDVEGTEYDYSLVKVDKDGVSTAFDNGKTISVGSTDVSARATFVCTVS